jgi:hypothetical protein
MILPRVGAYGLKEEVPIPMSHAFHVAGEIPGEVWRAQPSRFLMLCGAKRRTYGLDKGEEAREMIGRRAYL